MTQKWFSIFNIPKKWLLVTRWEEPKIDFLLTCFEMHNDTRPEFDLDYPIFVQTTALVLQHTAF